MKKFLIGVLLVFFGVVLFGQAENSQSNLESEQLKQETEKLNKLISEFSGKIENVIVKYKLDQAKNVTVLPYQTSYEKTDSYMKIEKHKFIRHDTNGKVIGIRKRSVKLYVSGGALSKIESQIYVRHYHESRTEIVTILDPSPTTVDTSDIIFSHTKNGRFLTKEKKMGEIKNTNAFPLANNLKRRFYIPHLTFFYDIVLSIAETYYRQIKDTDGVMTDFLEKSTDI